MPEVLLPFKDANQVTHDLRAWSAASSETQVVMLADPTSGTQRNLTIDASGFIGISTLPALPTGANTIGKVDQGAAGASAWKIDGSAVTQPVSIAATVTVNGSAVTQPVSIAATVATKEVRAATPTQSSVAASATTVTLLASNANRLGATIYNDSTVNLFLKLGATASSTSFTCKIAAAGYYEVPFAYTGIIDGLWDSATGNARITELAA